MCWRRGVRRDNLCDPLEMRGWGKGGHSRYSVIELDEMDGLYLGELSQLSLEIEMGKKADKEA